MDRYNALPLSEKEAINIGFAHSPEYLQFVEAFNNEPWKYEKPVLWNDRDHSNYFIEQLESAHAFEVLIDHEFKQRRVDIGLYYGRDAQYSGESEAGIEIKYDKCSENTNNFYIEYRERMWRNGPWVNSGILKDDNSRFFLCGTLEGYVIFAKETLVEYYERLMAGEHIPGIMFVKERQNGTSEGFILMPSVWRNIALSIDQVIPLLDTAMVFQ